MTTTTPIAAQMITVWEEADRDLAGTLERIASMGYLGIELVGLHNATPEEFTALTDALDLEIIGGSMSFLDEEEELEKYYGATRDVGSKYAMGHLQEKHFSSPDAVAAAADLCNRFAAKIQPAGVELMYHNHWWECTPRDDGTIPLVELASSLDSGIGLIVDVYWVDTAGIDVAGTLKELGPRVKRLHLKDGPVNTTDAMVAVGDGKVDIAAAVAAAPQVDWHVTELDRCDSDPMDALARSYEYLTEQGLSRGRNE